MLLYIAIVLTALVVSILLLAVVRHSKVRRMMEPVPGPRSYPVLGSTCLLRPAGLDFIYRMEALCKDYPESGMFKIWFGSHPTVFVYNADAVEAICGNSKHLNKPVLNKFLEPWLGSGILLSKADKWKGRRRMLTPAFHFKILEDFVQVFNEQAARMVEIMDQQAESGGFDIQPIITRCTLDIICETAMGYHVDAQNKADSEYFDAICNLADAVTCRKQSRWLWPNFTFNLSSWGRQHNKALKVLHSFTRQVIEDRCAELVAKQESSVSDESSAGEHESSSGESLPGRTRRSDSIVDVVPARKRLAFLDILLEAAREEKQLTHSEIQGEVDTFMFAGHDTTAASAVWLMYTIGTHPDVQRKLHDEVDSMIGESMRQLTMQDLSELKYMDCVIKETMRMYPAVSLFGRETSEECIIGGYTIPKGTTIAVLPKALHRDPKHFPEPDQFNPDRWMNQHGRHPYCYVPFSAGPRNCIGQKFAMLEEKMMLSHILHRFEVTCIETEIITINQMVNRPKDGLRIKLKRRNV